MRLWHEKILSCLPDAQLLGQHRECCALRGNAWGKKHAVVDYVFEHEPDYLYQYHLKVMQEMGRRGFRTGGEWFNPLYRGRNCPPYDERIYSRIIVRGSTVYPEHNDGYLSECLENLGRKGIVIDVEGGA